MFLNEYKKVFSLAQTTYVLPFLNMDSEKKDALNKIIDNMKIFMFNESIYIKDYSNTVFLFTGSKDMKKLINNLIKKI